MRRNKDTEARSHVPVLLAETLEGLRVVRDGIYLDGTYGRGGHAREVLARLGPQGRLLVMDRDPDAIADAEKELGADPRVAIRHASFAGLADWEETAGGLDGVLFDLGVSSPQLDEPARGFSFQADGPLDMRMDPTRGTSAADWLAGAGEAEIADVLWQLGEERMSRRIARAIVAARGTAPLTTTRQLADLVAKTIGHRERHKHPATRTFQALRIHVNDELGQLERGLEAAAARLKPAWPARGDQLPFAGRPHRQALHPRRGCATRAPRPAAARSGALGAVRGRQGDLRRRGRNRGQSARTQRGAARRGKARRRGQRMSLRAVIAMTILLGAVIASAIGVVYSSQQSRELFVELTKLVNERDDLNFEFGRLELEQATWAENNRIEQIARGRLGMVSPNPAETVVVRR